MKLKVIIKRFIDFLPTMPRKRYNIYAGTNDWNEWFKVLKSLLFNRSFESKTLISDYEHKFAQVCGSKYGISFGAGRMALFAILEALNIGEGDEVIIPAFTCVVVPNAILYRGAKPIYVDIKFRDFNIDIKKIKTLITKNTKALYAQHTFGVPCDVEALKRIAEFYNLPIIEDGAHALGTVLRGSKIGSLTVASFFSTDHSKIINTQFGGMAITNDEVLACKLRHIQSESFNLDSKDSRRLLLSFLLEYVCFSPSLLWIGKTVYRIFARLGLSFSFKDELKLKKPIKYPCTLLPLQAELGLLQLKKLRVNLSHRRKIATWLEESINWYQFSSKQINEYSWLRYSFLVKNRDDFIKKFKKNFDLDIWFTSVLSGRDNAFSDVGYKVGSCPKAEFIARHIVNIPTHQRISLKFLKKFLNENNNWMQQTLIKPRD